MPKINRDFPRYMRTSSSREVEGLSKETACVQNNTVGPKGQAGRTAAARASDAASRAHALHACPGPPRPAERKRSQCQSQGLPKRDLGLQGQIWVSQAPRSGWPHTERAQAALCPRQTGSPAGLGPLPAALGRVARKPQPPVTSSGLSACQ